MSKAIYIGGNRTDPAAAQVWEGSQAEVTAPAPAPTGQEMRVYGPPGTGKTTWISRQVRAEVESRGAGAVMITSLTKAAAETIVGRELPVPKENIGTLHSHCFRAIGAATIAETKYLEFNLKYPNMAISGDHRDIDESEQEQPENATPGDQLMSQYRLSRSRMEPRELLPPAVARFARAWQGWKEEKRYLDFTDLIEQALRNIAVAPGDPAVIFVDEAQDHDRLELALLRKWGRYAERVYIVGDPDQAIYEWRGSDPRAFMTPAVPEQNKLTLEQSYRVSPAVHRVALKWIGQIRDREPIEYRPRQAPGEVRRLYASYRRPVPILRDMERYLRDGKTVMMLTSCAYMLNKLVASLKAAGIPFYNPYRKKAGHWNPLRSPRGTSPTERVLAYLRPSDEAWPTDHRLYTYGDLRLWTEPLRAEGVLRRGMKQHIQMRPGEEPISIGSLIELFEPAAWERIRELDLAWYRDHLLTTRRPAVEFPLSVIRNRGAAALRQKPQVIIGTIHSVKGGQADAVYLFPDLAPSAYGEWIAAGPRRDALIRLFYVAMTRSAEDLVLCSPAGSYRIHGLMPGL